MNREGLVQLNNLLDKAIGSRSLRQFAGQIGLNVSTLSRIRSGQTRLSPELIRKIVANAEQPGIVIEEMFYSLPEGNLTTYHRSRFDEMKDLESLCTSTIMMDLLYRGYSLYSAPDDRRFFDLVVKTDSLAQESEKVWGFDILFPLPGRNKKDIGDYNDGSLYSHLRRCTSALYLGETKVDRMSFITVDSDFYVWLKEKCKDMKPMGEISFILIDANKRLVEEEYVLPPADGHIPTTPFLKRTKS